MNTDKDFADSLSSGVWKVATLSKRRVEHRSFFQLRVNPNERIRSYGFL